MTVSVCLCQFGSLSFFGVLLNFPVCLDGRVQYTCTYTNGSERRSTDEWAIKSTVIQFSQCDHTRTIEVVATVTWPDSGCRVRLLDTMEAISTPVLHTGTRIAQHRTRIQGRQSPCPVWPRGSSLGSRGLDVFQTWMLSTLLLICLVQPLDWAGNADHTTCSDSDRTMVRARGRFSWVRTLEERA